MRRSTCLIEALEALEEEAALRASDLILLAKSLRLMCIASGEAFSPSQSRHEHENSQFAGNKSRRKVNDASGVAY